MPFFQIIYVPCIFKTFKILLLFTKQYNLKIFSTYPNDSLCTYYLYTSLSEYWIWCWPINQKVLSCWILSFCWNSLPEPILTYLQATLSLLCSTKIYSLTPCISQAVIYWSVYSCSFGILGLTLNAWLWPVWAGWVLCIFPDDNTACIKRWNSLFGTIIRIIGQTDLKQDTNATGFITFLHSSRHYKHEFFNCCQLICSNLWTPI